MYMLIEIDPSEFRDIEDDKDFFTKLICEESISCLPASVSELDWYRDVHRFIHCCRSLVSIILFVLFCQRPWKRPKKPVRESLNSVDDTPKWIHDILSPLFSIFCSLSNIKKRMNDARVSLSISLGVVFLCRIEIQIYHSSVYLYILVDNKMNLKVLLFLLLITRSQQHFFPRLTPNETEWNTQRLQNTDRPSEKPAFFSRKVLVLFSACLCLVVIATWVQRGFTSGSAAVSSVPFAACWSSTWPKIRSNNTPPASVSGHVVPSFISFILMRNSQYQLLSQRRRKHWPNPCSSQSNAKELLSTPSWMHRTGLS